MKSLDKADETRPTVESTATSIIIDMERAIAVILEDCAAAGATMTKDEIIVTLTKVAASLRERAAVRELALKRGAQFDV